MHRATPSNTSFRAYSAGGARATISGVDDSKLMQESSADFMKGESRGKIETPHNYGFTSVPFDADKDENGQQTTGPEAFISFMGGNRSFPVSGPIDDRRHRLKGLEKGDVALFRGKDDGQQFHMNGIGGTWSANNDKKVRMQLVRQETATEKAAATAASPSPMGETGQKPVYKQPTEQYFELTNEGTESVNTSHTIMLGDKETAVHIGSDKKVYLGGRPEKGHRFAPVMTADGPSLNVYARIG